MNKRIVRWTVLFIIITIVILVIFNYRWIKWRFAFEEEQENVLVEKTYSIEPSLLLQSLALGRKDTFRINNATPEATVMWSNYLVPWKQIDYYFIASTFSKFILNESLDSWKLKEMFFNLDCKAVSIGFQTGGFTFFKTEHLKEMNSRMVRNIHILPEVNQVYFAEIEFYPEVEQWKMLNLEQIKISAENALQIAEGAGGSAFREIANNECYIHNMIESGGKYHGWRIRYSQPHKQASFEVVIDAITGKYKINR
jgi:hypothetical protein